ncbi:hypothetical protein SDC9_148197 [bioreactor metagenome]|uniref:Uncharacterized protein n=1 Tax=bioreactor metagenome TaxID=1076179 RepID=A0A645EIM7_9ZZZZ
MLETYHAVGGGKQRVVAALAHVHTGVDVGAALTNQNVARQDLLPVRALHAQTLGVGVTAILGGAAALFVGEELQTNVQHNENHPFFQIV